MEELWRILFIAVLILQYCSICSTGCSLPDFSHRKHFTSWKWFTSKRFVENTDSFDWGKLQKSSSKNDFMYQNGQRKDGDTILDFPFNECITDEISEGSLGAAPWEVRLSTKLLQEKAKGNSSKWWSYINALPTYVPLPILFTEMEMNNIEDSYIIKEIMQMRQFATLSFSVLRGADTAYAKFSEFVWSLSLVYSLACQVSSKMHELCPSPEHNGHVRIRDGTQKGDGFLLQGEEIFGKGAKLFSDINDIAEWFFTNYGGVNSNRYLTVKVSRTAIDSVKGSRVDLVNDDFIINPDGTVDRPTVCVLTSLFYARNAIGLHNKNQKGEPPLDFDNVDGTEWQRTVQIIATEIYNVSYMDLSRNINKDIRIAVKLAQRAIQKRIFALLTSYTTDIREDDLLLQAAVWEESLSSNVEESCSPCRWQIEKQSRNDVLATRYRFNKKNILQDALKFPFDRPIVNGGDDKASIEEVNNFSDWCEKHGLIISDKIAFSSINDSSYQCDPVRGVVALRDIEEGETLCTLALDTGLYDKSSASNVFKDSWDLAAVRLLEEKRLGKSSKWFEYIQILPRNMSSPIYLNSSDLLEVQWWPILRELIQVRRAIKQSFNKLQSSHYPVGDYNDYKWAVTMVHSRAFTLPVLPDDKYSHYVLMPFMDMINHHYIYQADWMSQPVIDRKLEIVAKRPLKKGQQLFASFGPRSNDNLFLYYGFVLKDNPFDSTDIFSSFEDALLWFIKAWTGDQNNRTLWETTWASVKQAIEEFEGGNAGQDKEWWELISRWADIGYQYLPYQPGPTVYSSGIIDPSLLAAFKQASTIVHLTHMETGSRNKTAYIQDYLNCLGRLRAKPLYKPLLHNQHYCKEHLVSALDMESAEARNILIARISLAVRCTEILGMFPTSVEDDLRLLRRGSPNVHLQLTREYRYRKKLQIMSVINRVLGGN